MSDLRRCIALPSARAPLTAGVWRGGICAVLLVAAGCGRAGQLADVQAEMAPSGSIRAALNFGNPVLARRGASEDEAGGIAVELARELGRRFGVPVTFLPYDSAAAMADDARTGAWDVAFLAADPAREDTIAFTPAYLELDASYLVPAGSPVRTRDEVDVAGMRISARPRSAYDLFLRRNLAHAELIYPETGETDLDLVADGRAHVLAGLRHVLVDIAAGAPEWRLLDGRFAAMAQAIGVPRQRVAAAEYLRTFVENAKASGLVAALIAANAAEGVSVAPLAAPAP